MLSQLTAALANPGEFTAEPTNALALASFGLFVLGALLPWAAGLVQQMEFGAMPFWSVIAGVSLMVVGFGGVLLFALTPAVAEHEYRQHVAEWLDEGYGITADGRDVFDLIEGGELVADVDGRRTIVTMTVAVNGDLDLIDRNRDVIEPR